VKNASGGLCPPGPHQGCAPGPQTPSLLLCPPNNPVRLMPLRPSFNNQNIHKRHIAVQPLENCCRKFNEVRATKWLFWHSNSVRSGSTPDPTEGAHNTPKTPSWPRVGIPPPHFPLCLVNTWCLWPAHFSDASAAYARMFNHFDNSLTSVTIHKIIVPNSVCIQRKN